MSKVNTPPRGLQSLLGNVNLGVNPSELNQVISPGIDLLPFWAVDKIRPGIASASISGTIGQGVTVAVPAGKIWLLLAVDCHYPMVAGQSLALSLRLTDPSAGVLMANIATNYVNNAPAVYEMHAGVALPQPLVLPTGWGIRGQIDMATDAAVRTMEVNYMYVPLDA